MPRRVAFDPEEVLDRAMQLFWRKGFEATSLPDLEAATGLSRSSLYNTFGSMRTIYLAVLDRYRDRGTTELIETLSTGKASDAIRAYFDLIVHASRGPNGRLGCFMTNALVERAAADEEVRRRGCESLPGMRAVFREAVERGRRDGDIPQRVDAAEAAALLTTGVLGLRAAARAGDDPAAIRASADRLLADLR